MVNSRDSGENSRRGLKVDPEEFDYDLSPGLIAQHAVVPKDHARMLVVQGDNITHHNFYDLPSFLNEGDILVINETKVSKAKIRGKKATGGNAELVLCETVDDRTFKCRIKSRNVLIGNRYIFSDLEGTVIAKDYDIFTVQFDRPITEEVRAHLFELPTPPYIKQALSSDEEYQTVYAKEEGSLAAPTAGLHFTQDLLDNLRKKGVVIVKVCLHVDYGTFMTVRGRLQDHRMHEEYFEVSKEAADLINNRKRRLFCVGTTSVRTLESAADDAGIIIPQRSKTDIFIYPGYEWKNRIQGLITNFHLPKSTLLMLVSSYIGKEQIFSAYKEAIKERYRFYSLGDATLLLNDA